MDAYTCLAEIEGQFKFSSGLEKLSMFMYIFTNFAIFLFIGWRHKQYTIKMKYKSNAK